MQNSIRTVSRDYSRPNIFQLEVRATSRLWMDRLTHKTSRFPKICSVLHINKKICRGTEDPATLQQISIHSLPASQVPFAIGTALPLALEIFNFAYGTPSRISLMTTNPYTLLFPPLLPTETWKGQTPTYQVQSTTASPSPTPYRSMASSTASILHIPKCQLLSLSLSHMLHQEAPPRPREITSSA